MLGWQQHKPTERSPHLRALLLCSRIGHMLSGTPQKLSPSKASATPFGLAGHNGSFTGTPTMAALSPAAPPHAGGPSPARIRTDDASASAPAAVPSREAFSAQGWSSGGAGTEGHWQSCRGGETQAEQGVAGQEWDAFGSTTCEVRTQDWNCREAPNQAGGALACGEGALGWNTMACCPSGGRAVSGRTAAWVNLACPLPNSSHGFPSPTWTSTEM